MLITAIVVLALAGGLAANRVLMRAAHRRGESADADGLSITDLASIVPTMSVLLLAFIMVATFDSWKTAGSTARDEANTALSVARAARFLPAEHGASIARSMLCYARSVEHREWATMADRRASNVPEHWSDAVSREIQDARETGGDAALDLASLERDLRSTRQVRLAQSTPSVPAPMTGLMVLSVVLSVFFLGMLTHAAVRPPVQLAALVGSTLLLTASLLLIREMDSPYSGPTRIEAVAMHHTAREVVHELAEYTTRQPAPCTRTGLPRHDGSFTARTEPIA